MYAHFQMLITYKKLSEDSEIPGCCELLLCCHFGPDSQIILNNTMTLPPLDLYQVITAEDCLEALKFCTHSDADKN